MQLLEVLNTVFQRPEMQETKVAETRHAEEATRIQIEKENLQTRFDALHR